MPVTFEGQLTYATLFQLLQSFTLSNFVSFSLFYFQAEKEQKKNKAAIEMFVLLLYSDEYNSPPYNLYSDWARRLSLDIFIRVAMAMISYHIKQAFMAYIALIPYIQHFKYF